MNLKEETLYRKIAYEGSFLKVEYDEVVISNGNKSSREVIRHPGAAAVLACVDGKYIIERQYRYPIDEVIYEIPAGKKDKDEDFIDTAYRELEEETGYKAASMKYLGEIYTSVGFCDERIKIYKAEGLTKTSTKLDPDEIVEIDFFTFDEIKEMIKKGIIKDAKTVAAFGLIIMED